MCPYYVGVRIIVEEVISFLVSLGPNALSVRYRVLHGRAGKRISLRVYFSTLAKKFRNSIRPFFKDGSTEGEV